MIWRNQTEKQKNVCKDTSSNNMKCMALPYFSMSTLKVGINRSHLNATLMKSPKQAHACADI